MYCSILVLVKHPFLSRTVISTVQHFWFPQKSTLSRVWRFHFKLSTTVHVVQGVLVVAWTPIRTLSVTGTAIVTLGIFFDTVVVTVFWVCVFALHRLQKRFRINYS